MLVNGDLTATFPPTLHRTKAALAAVLLVGGALGIHALGARPPAWYPPCLVHQLTGCYCPGCGCARALHALGQGRIAEAIDQNALATALVPWLAAWFVVSIWRGLVRQLGPPPAPRGTAAGILVATLLFTIARNLPWPPFTFLAPN